MSGKRSHLLKNIKDFLQSLEYCLSLSWKASKFYTLASFLVRLLNPIIGLISIYLGKAILDTLAAGTNNLTSKNHLILLFLLLGFNSILSVVIDKFSSYICRFAIYLAK